MNLIPEWKSAYKMWSVRLGVLGSSIVGFVTVFPDQAIQAWNVIPPELKTFIPAQYLPMIGVAIYGASLIARVIHQPSLTKDKENDPS